jgi:UDP-N-acetylmuramoyl-tripeptide--D-alanyl-D-alanine ligase
MTLLWETDALLAATKGRPVGQMPEGVSGISIDTRTLNKGDAYFAIKGDTMDGHDFVSAAMKAGASMAVVAEEKLVALGGTKMPLVVVRDVLEAMRQLGMAARARTKARIIAVTGSVGKTTTKEMLRTVLSASGSVHASVASFNNHWGVPITLARMPIDTMFGVFEIGMNHPDEIRPLVKMVRPHIGVITNVAAVHLGAFKDVDGIAEAKAEIFEGIVPGGYGVIWKDDKRAKLLADYALKAGVEHLMTFGTKKGSDFRLKSIETKDGVSDFSASLRGKNVSGVLNVPGDHMLNNALLVLGIADLAGADIEKSIQAVSLIEAEKGRGKRHQLAVAGGAFTLIDESYNANPTSMRSAMAALAGSNVHGKGRRIAVLGDMLELGEASLQFHKDLSKSINEFGIDAVFTIGPEIAVLKEVLDPKVFKGHFKDWEKARLEISKFLHSGDLIMLKASNGLRFAGLVEALCKKFAVKETRARLGK